MTRHRTSICLLLLALATPFCVYAKVTLECVVSGEVQYTDSKGVTAEQLPPEKVTVTIDDSKAKMPVNFKTAADYSFFMEGYLKSAIIKNISDDQHFKWTYLQSTKMSKTTGSIEIDRSALQIKVTDSWMHNKENLATLTRFVGACTR